MIAASPTPFPVTLPEASTVAVAWSSVSNEQYGVTSSVVPSMNAASIFRLYVSPFFAICSAGDTFSSFTRERAASSAFAPAAIHLRITSYSALSVCNRTPPPCSACPVGLRSKRLAVGSVRLTRRPPNSRMRRSWSPVGSAPKSDSRKPFCPFTDPWQVPPLQPSLLNTAETCRWYEGSSAAVAKCGSERARTAAIANRRITCPSEQAQTPPQPLPQGERG